MQQEKSITSKKTTPPALWPSVEKEREADVEFDMIVCRLVGRFDIGRLVTLRLRVPLGNGVFASCLCAEEF